MSYIGGPLPEVEEDEEKRELFSRPFDYLDKNHPWVGKATNATIKFLQNISDDPASEWNRERYADFFKKEPEKIEQINEALDRGEHDPLGQIFGQGIEIARHIPTVAGFQPIDKRAAITALIATPIARRVKPAHLGIHVGKWQPGLPPLSSSKSTVARSLINVTEGQSIFSTPIKVKGVPKPKGLLRKYQNPKGGEVYDPNVFISKAEISAMLNTMTVDGAEGYGLFSVGGNVSKNLGLDKWSNIPEGATGPEVLKSLGPRTLYRQLQKKHIYATDKEISLSKDIQTRMYKREKEIVAWKEAKNLYSAEKAEMMSKPVKERVHEDIRALKNKDKQLANASKMLTEAAGKNPFTEITPGVITPQIYNNPTFRKKVKEALPVFNDNLNRWHHEHRSADVGKSMLTEVTKDPYISVNLFLHMQKEGIFSSGIMENMILIKEEPHNLWHDKMKKEGYEPTHFDNKINEWANTEASIYQYIQDISKEVLAGNANINELFTIISRYGEAMKQINQEIMDAYGGVRFKDIPGLKEFITEYKFGGRTRASTRSDK